MNRSLPPNDHPATAGQKPHPFSRPTRIERLPDNGLNLIIRAESEELVGLAELFGLLEIRSLSASYLVRRAGRRVRVTGEVKAEIVQACVVTLDPLEFSIQEPIAALFAEEAQKSPSPSPHLDEDDESPDPIENGKIDLGALAAEFVALGIDPYPRKPDAVFDNPLEDEPEPSPFAKLAVLKEKL